MMTIKAKELQRKGSIESPSKFRVPGKEIVEEKKVEGDVDNARNESKYSTQFLKDQK